ncbi:MAG: ribosome maturation factor RimP [Coprothermobacterota bacterium]|nr:ribosome maturation factor RimP [Coprothermobacterota bacterium]
MEKKTLNSIEIRARPMLLKAGYRLLDVIIVGKREPVVRLIIFSPEGISLDDCQRVSRLLGNELDELFPARYRMEVSSPGLEREIRDPEEFTLFHGREAQIRLNQKIEGEDLYTGILEGVESESLLLEVDGRQRALPIPLIEKARLVYR